MLVSSNGIEKNIIMKLNYLLLFIFVFVGEDLTAQTYPFKSFGKGKFSNTFVSSNYKDTIIIVDTLKRTVIKNRIPEIRSAKFINEDGLILARISDGEGLVNSNGKMLNGPYNTYRTGYMKNGYVLTGISWSSTSIGRIIFNAKGDTIICKFNYDYDAGMSEIPITDTTLIEGYNHRTKRLEKGYLLKSGHWQTIEYLQWIKISEKLNTKK